MEVAEVYGHGGLAEDGGRASRRTSPPRSATGGCEQEKRARLTSRQSGATHKSSCPFLLFHMFSGVHYGLLKQ